MAKWKVRVRETTYVTYTFEADTLDAEEARDAFMNGVDTIEEEGEILDDSQTGDPELVDPA